MMRRGLGRSDLRIAPLVLGGNVFGWTVDEATSFALLDAFLDAGFNTVDTANMYSSWVPGHVGGESEAVIGAYLGARGQRERMILATKVGAHVSDWSKGYLSSSEIVREIEGSLRRLRTDYIDLYQAHSDDPDTPLQETLAAFESLIGSGKVRAIGASHYKPARLEEALRTGEAADLPSYVAMQPLYNLLDRTQYEGGLQDVCRDNDLGVLAYSSLAKGFLTGRFRTRAECAASPNAARLEGYLNTRGLRVLDALDTVAAEQGATPAQIALAWLMAQPGVTAAIAAANTVAQLDELMGAVHLTLDEDQLRTLSAASLNEQAEP